MQIIIAFLLVGAGFALYAIHGRICSKRECTAWRNGYAQAQKEEKIRQEAEKRVWAVLKQPLILRKPVPPSPMDDAMPSVEPIRCDFMDKLHEKGRAVVRLK